MSSFSTSAEAGTKPLLSAQLCSLDGALDQGLDGKWIAGKQNMKKTGNGMIGAVVL